VKTSLKETKVRLAALVLALTAAFSPVLPAVQSTGAAAGAPPSSGGFFPLSEVRRGMTATAWTVFEGTKPEPMQVEILGVLRGARGPGQDMILVQLHGAKPEYTGVVAGMSGSPVYVGNRLLGSLSYRIGAFSKDPIAGITPIAQMLEVRNLPLDGAAAPLDGNEQAGAVESPENGGSYSSTMQAMETPLVMSGFRPEAIRLWQQQMAGTSLDQVMAGGMGGSATSSGQPGAGAAAGVTPGSAVSAQLVRGDVEIAATCTVTYVDAKQLLACGHPILQAGPVSLPMTRAEVVTTVASPLYAFKIINTGEAIGAFTEDRESAIRGVFGLKARMIPMHISVDGPGGMHRINVEVLDLPSLTPQAVMVTLYDALLESNDGSDQTSYHLTGSVRLDGDAPAPLNLWVAAGQAMGSTLQTALQTGQQFARLYSNGARQGAVKAIDLHVEAIPRRLEVELVGARLVSGEMVHAGDMVTVEATVRPWQQPLRNIRISFKLPPRLGPGNLRLLVSDAATLDRTLELPHPTPRSPDLQTLLAEARQQHAADSIYVSLLVPETQAGMNGETLTSLPLSVANALEPLRAAEDVNLNGESAEVTAAAPCGGVLSGFQILNLHIEPGGGLN
jgi:hypothetical protein